MTDQARRSSNGLRAVLPVDGPKTAFRLPASGPYSPQKSRRMAPKNRIEKALSVLSARFPRPRPLKTENISCKTAQ